MFIVVKKVIIMLIYRGIMYSVSYFILVVIVNNLKNKLIKIK